jgi:hypothetical protein
LQNISNTFSVFAFVVEEKKETAVIFYFLATPFFRYFFERNLRTFEEFCAKCTVMKSNAYTGGPRYMREIGTPKIG